MFTLCAILVQAVQALPNPCPIGLALNRLDLIQCIPCNTGSSLYTIDNMNICHEVCGKGTRITQELECDDGNIINGDGCSSTCLVEKSWMCFGGSSSTSDSCFNVISSAVITRLKDPSFYFEVSFVQDLNLARIEVTFSQKPIFKAPTPLKDIFDIHISGLSIQDFSYSVFPANRRRALNERSLSSRMIAMNAPLGATLYIDLTLSASVRQSQITVSVDQSSIMNENGLLLWKTFALTDIKKFDFHTYEEILEAKQTQAWTNAAKSTLVFSGVSITLIYNFSKLANIIDVTELIYYFLFLDMDYPLNLQTFFRQFSALSLSFIPNPLRPFLNSALQSCNPHLKELQTDSLFLRNAGTNIFLFIVLFFLILLAKCACILINKLSGLEKLKIFSRNRFRQLRYDTTIDTIFFAYLNIVSSAFLQFQDLTVGTATSKETITEIINLILFFIIFIICLLLPVLFLLFLWKNRVLIEYTDVKEEVKESATLIVSVEPTNAPIRYAQFNNMQQFNQKGDILKQKQDEFISKWGRLFAGCKRTSFRYYAFNSIIYFRKIYLTSVIMLMMGNSEVQLFLLVANHIFFAIYISKLMPYEKYSQNIINIFTEIIFALLEVLFMRFSSQPFSFIDQQQRDKVGRYAVDIFIFIIFLHLVLMLVEVTKFVVDWIRTKISQQQLLQQMSSLNLDLKLPSEYVENSQKPINVSKETHQLQPSSESFNNSQLHISSNKELNSDSKVTSVLNSSGSPFKNEIQCGPDETMVAKNNHFTEIIIDKSNIQSAQQINEEEVDL